MAPAIILNPTHAKVGTTGVLITGSGYTASDPITFTYGGGSIVPTDAPITADLTGAFTAHITIPASVEGIHAVAATDAHAGTASANFTVDSFGSISPTHAKVGDTVTVTLTGFATISAVVATFDGNPLTLSGSTTDSTGGLVATFVVPTSKKGNHTLSFTDAASNNATITFATDQSISLSPSTQKIGGVTTITGKGFAANSAVVITIGGIPVIGVTTDANGGFVQAETVPTLPEGSQTVSATDAATNNATATLTVSSDTVTLTPNNGPVGTSVTITGTDYIPNAILTITNADGTKRYAQSDSSGNIPSGVVVTIPNNLPQGTHAITVTDGENTASANFTINPALSASVASAVIGESVGIVVTGLAANSAITVDLSGTSVTPAASPTTDENGNYSGTIIIPTKTSGAKTITVTDASSNAPTTSLTVIAPTIVLSTRGGPVGTNVSITGLGFIPRHTLTITNADAGTSTVTSDNVGNVPPLTSILIGAAKAGNHNITVSDGTNTATVVFVISPQITVNPINAPIGQTVTIEGTGFDASVGVTVELDSTSQTILPDPTTSDSSGNFTNSFVVQSGVALAAHVVTATDASSFVASTPLTVSDRLPLTPIGNNPNQVILEDFPISILEDSYTNKGVIEVKRLNNIFLELANLDEAHTLTYELLGIVHESDNIVPPIDTAGLKLWNVIESGIDVAAGASSIREYTANLYSYILLRTQNKVSSDTSTALLSFKGKN